MAQTIKLHHVDFYPTDWLEGTISLTHVERSVYITICAAIFATGERVEIAHVRKLCGGKGFYKGLAGLVEKGKVTREGSLLGNIRALKEHSAGIQRSAQKMANLGKINGLAAPTSRARPSTNTNTIKKKPSSSSLPSSARASSLSRGATRAHDTEDRNASWKQLSAIMGQPATPAPEPSGADLRQRHMRYLRERGTNGDLELYLAAQMSDDPQAAQRMLDLTNARMQAEGWEDHETAV
jgi:hypothetical protein